MHLTAKQALWCVQILSGACVNQGELEAKVTAVGGNTFFGKTIALLGEPEQRGHLQQASHSKSVCEISSQAYPDTTCPDV